MTLAERIGAYVSLLLLTGLIAFMVLVEIPGSNKDVIMLIAGAITTAAATGVAKLSGGGEDKKYKELKEDHDRLKEKFERLEAQYDELSKQYTRLTERLVNDHVLYDETATAEKFKPQD